ncbi:MAG: hydroxyectoine utilization dehydratase EutB [Sedimenticola sp.]|nr:hydroxyectoine utilization dehydratase EutB [Sedimenticola sp.]
MRLPDDAPTLADIYRARRAIHGYVRRTPLVYSEWLSRRFDCQAWLKLETLQPIGAFKLRGASYAMQRLEPEQRRAGVVTCSTGNHGRAIAHAGKKLGVDTVICMSHLVPENKVAVIRELGATVQIIGDSQDEAEGEALRLVREEGRTYLPPFDHPDIIAGQGTIGLEILEDLPEVETIFCGLSGGGLLAGIGLAVKAARPDLELIGVSMQQGAAMVASLAAGSPVRVTERASLADSLGGGIGDHNRYTLPLVRSLMDRSFLVSEDAIARAMVAFLEHERQLVEGAAVVGIAAVEEHSIDLRGCQVVFVISGNNLSLETFDRARAIARDTG